MRVGVWMSRFVFDLHSEDDHVLIILQAENDGTLQAADHKIYDSLGAKTWALRLATEAAISVLSVDSIIMSKPAGGPKVPQQAGNWDEDD